MPIIEISREVCATCQRWDSDERELIGQGRSIFGGSKGSHSVRCPSRAYCGEKKRETGSNESCDGWRKWNML